MSAKSDTIHEITDQRDAAETKIEDALDEIERQKRLIFQAAAGRPLTAAESAQIDAYDGGINTLVKADTDLELASVVALNDAAKVAGLSTTLAAINTDLKTSIDDINKVAATIKEIGDAVKIVDSIVQSLAKLAPLLGV